MFLKQPVTLLFSLALLCLPAGHSGASESYDIAILNGRVMDPETGYDAIANVGISNGRIMKITTMDLAGDREIDATGLVVAPGFIDTHFHWTRPLGYRFALRDGVTTAMDLEAGVYGPRVGDWYAMHAGRSLVNYGTASGHEFARTKVMQNVPDEDLLDAPHSVIAARGSGTAWFEKVAGRQEMNRMLAIIDDGLRAGAIGVASTLGYFSGATAREIFEIQRLAASYGRQTGVHLRFTPGTETTEVVGAQEILANAVALEAPAMLNHFNNPGWAMVQDLLVRLRSKGHNVWGEIYPYVAGQTTINAQFLRPGNWVKKLGHRYETTLQDPSTGEFYTQTRYEEVLAESPTSLVLVYKGDVRDIEAWCALPGVTYASDAIMLPGTWDDSLPVDTPFEDVPTTHPRLAGTHGKCFRVGREAGIPLMQLIAASSYNPARYLGETGLRAMQERGRLQEGMVADITLLNPDTISDHATYSQGTLPTTGIPYVIVNGTIVLDESVVRTDLAPGLPIRFPERADGRFEPIDESAWERPYLRP